MSSVKVTSTKRCSTQVSQLHLETEIGVDLARNQTAVHDGCSGSQDRPCHHVCHDHTSQPQIVVELEAYAIQVSQLLLETGIGVNLARNQSAVRWEPRTDLAIPTMTGRPHHIDRDWPQPPPDRSARPSHNHIKKFLILQRSGLDEVLETIYNTVERTDVPSLPAHLRALKDQRSDMDKVLEIIYDNINQERPEVPTCQPELKRKLYGLMADHNDSIKFLTFKLNAIGPDYGWGTGGCWRGLG